MDIKLEKKPWYIRYRYYLIGGLLFAAFLIYVIVLSLGPRKLRIDAENIQIAEVKEDNFMEYVDVEGLIQKKTKMRLRRTIDIKKINCMNLMLNLKEAGAFVMSVEVVE